MNEELAKMQISDEDFEKYVRLTSMSDNREDDLRRAHVLGFKGDVRVAPGAILRIPFEQVGQDVFFGLYTYCNGDVTIGNHVLIGPHCSLAAGNHLFDAKTGCFSARSDVDNSIVIGDGCWLASGVTVTAGVKVGKANLVCAGAVLTRSTPDYAIMAGMPAKQIGSIDKETGKYIWFK